MKNAECRMKVGHAGCGSLCTLHFAFCNLHSGALQSALTGGDDAPMEAGRVDGVPGRSPGLHSLEACPPAHATSSAERGV
jgi:hypothetical protein